jgi:mRNA interferase MazF
LIPKGEGGLTKDSVALCNQIRSVDETRFGKTRGHVSPGTMGKIDHALKISLGLV